MDACSMEGADVGCVLRRFRGNGAGNVQSFFRREQLWEHQKRYIMVGIAESKHTVGMSCLQSLSREDISL